MNTFQGCPPDWWEVVNKADFETLTAGFGTSAQPFEVRPMPASRGLVVSKRPKTAKLH